MLRKEHKKKDRKIEQNMLEKRWEMMKWVTQYIDENSDKWEREKMDRQTNVQNWLQDWARMTRLEKIKRKRDKHVMPCKKLSVSVKSPVLKIPAPARVWQP